MATHVDALTASLAKPMTSGSPPGAGALTSMDWCDVSPLLLRSSGNFGIIALLLVGGCSNPRLAELALDTGSFATRVVGLLIGSTGAAKLPADAASLSFSASEFSFSSSPEAVCPATDDPFGVCVESAVFAVSC